MVQALKIAKKKIGEGTKVIISRDGTAEYLRQNLSVPVVNIRHGFYDIHPAVQQARKYSDKIGVIGFDSLCVAAEDYKQVMECSDMYVEKLGQYSQYEEKIREMRSHGAGAIIGGLGLRKFEGAYGFHFVAGGGSEYSVRDAINEALEQLRVDRERSQQDRILNAVINSTLEGIVGFCSDGQIIHINHVAKRLLNYDAQETIQELFPELFRGNEKEMMRSLPAIDATSEKIVKHGKRMLALNTAPIIVDGQRIGTAVTIQEQDYIQTMDRKIRKELVGRGHVAKNSFEDIIGNSSRMEEVKRIAKRYAESSSTILITGETGVGKEVFAQSIHNYSARKKPFVAVNCAALPHDILESELFGYVKGAFTGTRGEGKLGIFELAHTGTVFLDEISELPILNSPNNPTGVVYSREALEAVETVAREHGLYVISDEIYEKLVYEKQRPFVSYASVSKYAYEHSIVINGVSKAYAMTGWRIGYAAGSTDCMKALIGLIGHMTSSTNTIAQYAALEELTGPQESVSEMCA